MKDEAMAEEYVTKNARHILDTNNAFSSSHEAFLAGLKAGRPQWHDLRKDPNDYPKQVGKCIRVVEWNGDEHIGYTEWYEPSEDEIGFGSLVVDLVVNGFSFEFDNIMAWCEIPTFDKE